MTESDTNHSADTKRRLAEKRAQRLLDNAETLPPAETRRLLHELREHQIELETQNEELRRTQAELETARARYFDLYDLAPVGYCTVSEQGLILEANLAAAGLLGAVRSELIKEPLTSFILKEDQDIYYLHRKRLFETGAPQRCELRLMRSDGSQLWARLDATVAEEVKSPPVCRLAMIDITDRKRADEKLRQSEETFRAYVSNAPYAIFITDVEGHYTDVNEAACRLTGYSRDELLKMTIRELAPSDTPPEALQTFDNLKKTGETNSEIVIRRKDGSIMYASLDAVALSDERYMAFCADITERIHAEEKLRRSEKRLKSLYSSMSDGAALHEIIYNEAGEAVDYRILDVNPAFEAMTGLMRGAAIGVRASELYQTGIPPYLDIYNKVAESGNPTQFESFFAAMKKSFRISVFSPGRSQFATVFSDITVRKQAEDLLKKAHAELEERVEQRTADLSRVNADLKELIRVREQIEKKLREHQIELQTLASELSVAEERERRRFAESLHDTISQSLVMAHMKLESLTVDKLPGEVSDSIRQINQMVGQALESTQTLTFELSPPVLHRLGLGPAIESLADQLHNLHGLKVELVDNGSAKPLPENIAVLLFRAVRELLINVIKHAETLNAKVTITAPAGKVRVEVEDEGAGFDPTAQSGHPRREGFGLFNIQERLTHLGGSCTIQSKSGKGTRITLSAPLVTAGKITEGKYV